MATFEILHLYVFIASVIVVGLYPIRAYWKILGLYSLACRRVGAQVKRIGFFWFSFYVQSPWFGRGADVLAALPQDLQTQASIVRNRQRREINAIALWIAFVVFLGFFIGKPSPRTSLHGSNTTGVKLDQSLGKCGILFPTGQGAVPGINCTN
jgi:hypothetical protein